MNFDLAWLHSHLCDITAARQAVEKAIRMPQLLFLLLTSFARGSRSAFCDRSSRVVLFGDGSERGSWHVFKASWRRAWRYSWAQCITNMLVVVFVEVAATAAIASAIASIA